MTTERALYVLKIHQDWEYGLIETHPFSPEELRDARNLSIANLEVFLYSQKTQGQRDTTWDLGTK